MKKQFFVLITFILLFSIFFSMPTQALSKGIMWSYILESGYQMKRPISESFGSRIYWENQIANGKWTGENRPEPLMGDANIDGKVNAVDALFALYFAINGNVATDAALSDVRTPYSMQWDSTCRGAFYKGTQQKLAESTDTWLTYCYYNSPFFADVTKDCMVTAQDALEILKYSVGKAENFPVGDFTSIYGRFCYYIWPTEYYPELAQDYYVEMTDEEFCEKYNFEPETR